MENAQPSPKTAVIGIDVLHVGSTAYAYAGTQVDGLMADAGLPGKSRIRRMPIGHQQDVAVDYGQQAMQQLRLRQLPLARDASDGLSRTIARHQDADLFAGNAPLPGTTTTPARRALQMPRAFFRLQQIHFIGFGDAVQAARAIGFRQCQKTMTPAETGVAVYAQPLCGLAYRI